MKIIHQLKINSDVYITVVHPIFFSFLARKKGENHPFSMFVKFSTRSACPYDIYHYILLFDHEAIQKISFGNLTLKIDFHFHPFMLEYLIHCMEFIQQHNHLLIKRFHAYTRSHTLTLYTHAYGTLKSNRSSIEICRRSG